MEILLNFHLVNRNTSVYKFGLRGCRDLLDEQSLKDAENFLHDKQCISELMDESHNIWEMKEMYKKDIEVQVFITYLININIYRLNILKCKE